MHSPIGSRDTSLLSHVTTPSREQPKHVRSRSLTGASPELAVERRAALAELEIAARKLLTAIKAPVGYGKTTLMNQFAERLKDQGHAVGWLTLDSLDRSPGRLVGRLARAIQASGIAFDSDPVEVEDTPEPRSAEDLVVDLTDTIASAEREVFLFLDDVQVLKDAPSTQLLRVLLDRAPSNLHLVMGTRKRPPIPTAKLRFQGKLLELDETSLDFSSAEAHELFEGRPDFVGPIREVIESRCHGWVAGLSIAKRLLAEGPVEKLWERLTGDRREFAELFEQEVLSDMGADAQDMLVRSSILDQLTPKLCDTLGAKRSHELLERANAEGCLIRAVDAQNSWFRIHPLFSQYLQRKLRDECLQQETDLHKTACDWCLENKLFYRAFCHAVSSQDIDRAARILDAEVLASWCSPIFGLPKADVLNLCSQIPIALKMRYPRILLLEAWRRDLYWQFESTEELLSMTRQIVQRMEEETPAIAHNNGLRGLLLHGEMMKACIADELSEVEPQCQELIKRYSNADPYVKASFYNALQLARREHFKLDDLERLRKLSYEYGARIPEGPARVFTAATFGPSYLMTGRLDTAVEILESGLSVAIRLSETSCSLGALAALPLAEVLYERNELSRAQKLLDDYLPFGKELLYVDQLVAGWCTAGRLRLMSGDTKSALEIFLSTVDLGRRHNFERLTLSALCFYVRALIGLGRIDDARRCAMEFEIADDPHLLLPSSDKRSTRDELRALICTRIALAENRWADAGLTIKHWHSFAESAGALRNMLRWGILKAQLQLVSGDALAAQRTLRRALTITMPAKFIRSFVDEGSWLETMLRRQAGAAAGPSPVDHFIAELLEAFERQDGRRPTALLTNAAPDESTQRGVFGALSPRETEILTLIARGLRNREIGDRVGMTEGSVKWYLQRIYDKFGVRRRSQALDRALQLGVISF